MPENGSQKPRREGRPIPIPPALFSAAEPFDGFDILDEVRSPAGALLWHAVRDVVLWATASRQSRARLFSENAYDARVAAIRAADLEDTVRKWLAALAGVLSRQDQPSRADVARNCRKVAEWAEERMLPRTAIWYAQAAALSFPERAEHAYAVGLLCRKNSEYARAETWFRRAIGFARRRHDAATYAQAFRGLGDLYIRRNEHSRAKAAFERAFRTARRAGIRSLRAKALHDLFAVAAETNQIEEAEFYARKAFRAYHRTHPNRATLAHDTATFWVLQGQYARALPVLQAVLKILKRPSDRLFALSNLARAAGAVERIDVFTSAWADTWQIIDSQPTLECVTSSLLRLGYGSAHLRDWERVQLAAGYALELATRRGEEDVKTEAKALLEAVSAGRYSESVRPSMTDPGAAADAEKLAREMATSLTACAGGDSPPRTQC